ncbi:MAG TPA: acyl carrier protein [Gemmatimonadaceae bacterium]|jgi:acyl carrier protein|nr:acyl carrier protein [Gemmatimonadaceae bacterium]
MRERIREILRSHGQIQVGPGQLGDDADLYQAGLTSHASVNLMLALEDEFEVEFPESLLLRRTFESVNAIEEALQKIRAMSSAS